MKTPSSGQTIDRVNCQRTKYGMGMRIDTKKVVNEGEVSSYHPNPGSVLAQSFDQTSSGNEFYFDFFRID